jgi:hypothetical protein
MSGPPHEAPGPFRAHQIRDGDPYELSDGHAIRCMTAGERHARANLEGGRVLATDPAVNGAVGVDAGFSFNGDRNLRPPDLSVGVGTHHPRAAARPQALPGCSLHQVWIDSWVSSTVRSVSATWTWQPRRL